MTNDHVLPSPAEQSERFGRWLAEVTGLNYQSILNGAPLQNGCRFAHDASAARLREEILALNQNKKINGKDRQTQIAALVVLELAKRGHFYFHEELRDFETAMFFDSTDKVLRGINSDEFVAFVSEWTSINRADPTFLYINRAINNAALSGPTTTGIIPERYWASRPGVIYLSNGDGMIVRISAAEITEVDNGTDGILFSTGKTMKPWDLIQPQDPFQTCRIFSNVHCSAAHGQDLLRLWMYSIPTNPISKPPICPVGPVGSGKTRTIRAIAELYGVPFVAQKYDKNRETDFWAAINSGGIFCLDNVDNVPRKDSWLADALANASTGGGTQQRRFYTNDETVTLLPKAWLSITSANPEFANDAGLADRLLVVRMDPQKAATDDNAISVEIANNRDSGLSHIAHAIHEALGDIAPTPHINARHPDFSSFAVRLGRGLQREAQAITALTTAESDKSTFCLENDPVGAAVISLMRSQKEWSGTSSALLDALKDFDPDLGASFKGQAVWTPKRIGKRLSALWPHIHKSFPGSTYGKDRKGIAIFTLATEALF